jgi:hypothetical protein
MIILQDVEILRIDFFPEEYVYTTEETKKAWKDFYGGKLSTNQLLFFKGLFGYHYSQAQAAH